MPEPCGEAIGREQTPERSFLSRFRLTMNEKNLHLAEGLISHSYLRAASEARRQRENLITILLAQRRLPSEGWDEQNVEVLLQELASMDSNNFVSGAGVGEREGRVFSSLVARRYCRLSHGIGRSGDLTAEQPKASGSSLLQKLTNYLVLDALHLAGLARVSSALVVPLATGMSLTLCLLGLRQQRPTARLVLWPRVDQKTCLKAIVTAGCTPVVVANVHAGDELVTDVEALERELQTHGVEAIVAIVSTTSVFAPRAPDRCVLLCGVDCTNRTRGRTGGWDEFWFAGGRVAVDLVLLAV